MNDNSISKLLALTMTLGISNCMHDNFYLISEEKFMNYSVSLIMEIDDLLDMGYTKDEIVKIIKECDFCAKDAELTKEDGEYLRSYCIRMLDIRFNLYIEEKNRTKMPIKRLKKGTYKKV